MPKIGSNYDKERFESLYKQIAEHDENFTVDHVRSFVEDALSKIDAEYLEAIENILLGKDGKTAELSAYFDTDDMFLDEEDKVLAERDVLSVVTFLHGIANGKYTLLNQRKEIEDKEEAPITEQAFSASSEKEKKEKEEEQEEIQTPQYFLSDEEFRRIFMEDRVTEEIGKRYEIPLFHAFADRVVEVAEGIDKTNLKEKFLNTYEKIPTEYYEFIEKVVIGVNGVREDPRDYIDMTDDAFEKFFSFAAKSPDEPLTAKDAKKIMNIFANLVEGTISLNAKSTENGPHYYQARLPEIAEKETALREEEERLRVVAFEREQVLGESVYKSFMEENDRKVAAASKAYSDIKKEMPLRKTAEQKGWLENARAHYRSTQHKTDVLTKNKKLYDKENKKLNKAGEKMRRAQAALEILERKKALLGSDFSKEDQEKLGKAKENFFKADRKLGAIKADLLQKTDARIKDERDFFPEHTAMRREQIIGGKAHFMPLATRVETVSAYGDFVRKHSEMVKQDYLADQRLHHEIENENLGAAIKAVQAGRDKMQALQSVQPEKGTRAYKDNLMQRKDAAKEAKAAVNALKSLREKMMRETVARAEMLGNPYPEHTAMRCEQIRTGQLDFIICATKDETIRANPQISEKTKQMILDAKVETPAKSAMGRKMQKSKESAREERPEQEFIQDTESKEAPKPAREVKRTLVKFPEGAIPSTTKYDPIDRSSPEKIQEAQAVQTKSIQDQPQQSVKKDDEIVSAV